VIADLFAPWRRLRQNRGTLAGDAALAAAATFLGLLPASALIARGRPLAALGTAAAVGAAEILYAAALSTALALPALALGRLLRKPDLGRRLARAAVLVHTVWVYAAVCPPLIPFVGILRLAAAPVLAVAAVRGPNTGA